MRNGESSDGCMYYLQHIDQSIKLGFGSCLRYPPQVVTVDGDNGMEPLSLFPDVANDDVCGEFKGAQ